MTTHATDGRRDHVPASAAFGATPAPVGSATINDHTVQSVNCLNQVTAACHAILNTIFLAPSPKPDWFDDLNAALDRTKVHANKWIDDLAPELTSSIPAMVVQYGSTYDAITRKIKQIADAHPDAEGKDNPYVIQVSKLVEQLDEELVQILKVIDATADQLKIWGDAMQKSHDELYNGAANIQKASIGLQQDIEKMNSAITSLRDMIDTQRKVISGMGALVGVGAFALIAGIALAPVTGGASLIVSGVGALAIVGGAVTWGVLQGKINDEFADIAKDQTEIAEDERQIVALQGLSLASDGAISSTALATSALSNVRTMWEAFGKDIKGVMTKLEKADTSLSMVVKDSMVEAAAVEWALAMEFANSLTTTVGVEKKSLAMDGKMAA